MLTHLKILMLEDSPKDAVLMERALRKDGLPFQTLRVTGKEEFISQLKHFKPDIVLSDHSLPKFNSQEALKISKDLNPDLPFILVTGAVSDEFAVRILKQGADDYILKSNLTRLPTSIRQVLKQYNLKVKKDEAEETLRKQNLELKRVNEELDNFVYSASHDLRSPLSTIMGLINVALLNANDPVILESCLQKMMYTVTKLDKILLKILAFSYNARLEVKSEKINLDTLIQECFEMNGHLKNARHIQKRINIYHEVDLYSDAYRLQLIFSNLISNAIIYRDVYKTQNYIDIDIHVSNTLSITFKDNGIGIKNKNLSKIFEMFYRGSEKSEGAGLGLYITKEAVAKLNGKIVLESISGKGTKFVIIIPNTLPEVHELTV